MGRPAIQASKELLGHLVLLEPLDQRVQKEVLASRVQTVIREPPAFQGWLDIQVRRVQLDNVVDQDSQETLVVQGQLVELVILVHRDNMDCRV